MKNLGPTIEHELYSEIVTSPLAIFYGLEWHGALVDQMDMNRIADRLELVLRDAGPSAAYEQVLWVAADSDDVEPEHTRKSFRGHLGFIDGKDWRWLDPKGEPPPSFIWKPWPRKGLNRR